MVKNFIAEVIHATKRMITRDLKVEGKATVKLLDATKIVDNGTVYGTSDQVKALTVDPEKNKSDAGTLERVARVDHTHQIPEAIKNPNVLVIRDNANNEVVNYDGSQKQELKITPLLAGAAKENHASPYKTYGVGDDENYGHLKLSDSINNGSSVSGGVAATPNAIRQIATHYLPLDGSKRMTGTLQTIPHMKDDNGKTIPAIRVGGAAVLADSGKTNILELLGASDPSIGAISFGEDKSTILLSKQTGHLYLKNSSEAQKQLGFTVDGERMIVDYQIEQIFTANGTKYWIPQRTGWYRIYVVGGGGNGAAGFVQANGIRRGTLANNKPTTPYAGTKNNHYEGTYMAAGYAVPGCGGGGGGVAVTDIYVSKEAYAYQTGTASISQQVLIEEEDADGNITTSTETVTEEYSVETPIQKKAVIKINTKTKTAQISNLFALYGGNVNIGTVVDEGDAEGDSDTDDLDVAPINSDVSPIIGYPGIGATVGALFPSTNQDGYGYRNVLPPELGNEQQKATYNAAQSWLNTNNGNITGQFKGYLINVRSNDPLFDYKVNDYFVKEGTRFDGSAATPPDTTWRLFDGTTHLEKGNYTNADVQKIVKTYRHTTTTWGRTTFVGPSFNIGKRIRVSTGQGTSERRYNYYGIRFSMPGIGGRSVGGDVNHRGGNGDVTMVKPPTTKSTIPGYNSDLTPEGYPFRADGYCGGVPGLNLSTGCVGGNASGGYIKNITAYEYDRYNKTASACAWRFIKKGIIAARSGYGASLNITELGNYAGPSIATPTKNKAGKGYLGGGGGGGFAMFAMGISKNDAGNNVFALKKSTLAGNVGGNPCVVIAYLGDSEPKEQDTTDTVIGVFTDSNNDGIDDTCQVFINYVAKDDSVAGISGESKVANLVDGEGNLTEFGTADISNLRPSVTRATGYTGNPIYEPSETIIDSNFGDGGRATIEVHYEKDPSMWHNVEFVAGSGGTLTGTTQYNDQLTGTTLVAPTPVPNSGYRFVGWEPALPQTINSSTTYTAIFEELYSVTFLPGDHGTLTGTTQYTNIISGSTFSGTAPTVTPNEGYEFDAWSPEIPTTVTSNVTCTATYKEAST